MDQLLNWVARVPIWVAPVLAAAAAAAAGWLFTQWKRRGGEDGKLRIGLIILVVLAIAGALPRVLPQIGLALVRLMGEGAALQLELLSLVASVVAGALGFRGRQLLPSSGFGAGGDGSEVSTIWSQRDESSGAGQSTHDQQHWEGSQADAFTTGGAGESMQRQDTILRRPSPKKGQVAWLSALRGPHTGHDWMLAEDNTLGRGSTDPCDIVLSDAKVSSGQHARIRLQKDGTYHLADLASRNGTWVNGQRVERHTLSSGEKIVIGDTELIFMQADIRPTKGRRGPGGAQ